MSAFKAKRFLNIAEFFLFPLSIILRRVSQPGEHFHTAPKRGA